VHNGTSWRVTDYDVLVGGPRVGFALADGTTKTRLGRVKQSAADPVDNAHAGRLLEPQA
jgi:hypothetical protein